MGLPEARRRRHHQAEAPVPAEVRGAVTAALRAIAPVRRDKALPLLQEIQARLGGLPENALALASRESRIPLAELRSLLSFYHLLTSDTCQGEAVHLCDDLICRTRAGTVPGEGGEVRSSPCLGQCDRGPAALVTTFGSDGPAYGGFSGYRLLTRGEGHKGWLAGCRPLLLERCGRYQAGDVSAYRSLGGLAALERARSLAPGDLVALVKSSRLVGRGGAAFPTGIKWEGVLTAPTPTGPGPDGASKYVVVNADESEPGTFTNRVLMEEDPLAVVEAALIAAHGVGAQQVYIYIRGEYPVAIDRVRSAVAAMRDYSGGVALEVRVGGGAYVCGEETALFASIEGERGEPRVKPPFPTTHGLFGRPTLINNVETLHNLLPLLTLGAEAWNAALPKLFSISGDVRKPGVYEVPLGTPLQELIDLAGGPEGEIQAVLMGGASGMFLGPDRLDTPLDFRAMAEAGATLGSGAVMVFNAERDLWDIAGRAARFFAEESCGKCVPCRVGTARQAEMTTEMARGRTEWAELHGELGIVMADASICGLGQTATNAVRSLLTLKGVK